MAKMMWNAGCIMQPHWLLSYVTEFPRKKTGVSRITIQKRQQYRVLSISVLHKPRYTGLHCNELATFLSSIRTSLHGFTARWSGKADGLGKRMHACGKWRRLDILDGCLAVHPAVGNFEIRQTSRLLNLPIFCNNIRDGARG
jgi:hypothetical protein